MLLRYLYMSSLVLQMIQHIQTKQAWAEKNICCMSHVQHTPWCSVSRRLCYKGANEVGNKSWTFGCLHGPNSTNICDGWSRPAAKAFLTQPAFIKHPSDAFLRTGAQPSSVRHSYIANNLNSPGCCSLVTLCASNTIKMIYFELPLHISTF